MNVATVSCRFCLLFAATQSVGCTAHCGGGTVVINAGKVKIWVKPTQIHCR